MYGKNIDMSMRELGDRVELTEGTIQRYETGQIKGVDINLLNKISETLKEIEQAYEGIKADTLRSYITRKTVIPEQCHQKLGNQWFIKRNWIEKNYKLKGDKK